MTRRLRFAIGVAVVCCLVVPPASGQERKPRSEPCASHDPQRRPYFGDTHVHTTYSQDASTQGTRVTPRDAYRFAKGEPLGIQPYDESGRAGRTVSLDRPLDFTVVTDHAEQLGEVHICKTPGLEGHGSIVCWLYRSWPRVAFYVMNARYALFDWGRWGFCGEDGEHCLEAAGAIWADTQEAAEEAYDRSAGCAFTSFVGYEWTAGPGGSHLHRNVVFRNEVVPELPISRMETGHTSFLLWKKLDEQCRQGGRGCEALTIPHNSNLGGGLTFTSAAELDSAITAEEAPLRNRYDRLAEVMQHKGDSECALYPGETDEACAFETVTTGNPLSGNDGPPESVDYVRDALQRGIRLERTLGTNPLKYGLLASTDTHLGTPGLVKERGHPGHGGAGMPARDAIPPGLQDFLYLNPGGLAVLWAEENRRDALFDAMLRREAYGTSGTRPSLRFFASFESSWDATLCEASDLAARGYAEGVPMGGDLPPPAGASAEAPRFLVAAMRDPAAIAAPLERIEIVKGWLEGDETRVEVRTIAGGASGAEVDLDTCERRGAGHESLCTVWSDPAFDPAAPAFYYVRLRENPSCRWSQWACVDAGVDCADPYTIGEGFEPCCSEDHVRTIQERAWSSPIWYTPTGS